jgi:hypothetical protein
VHLLLSVEREHRVPERAAALLQGGSGSGGVRGRCRWVERHTGGRVGKQGLSMASNVLIPWFEVGISSPMTRHRRPPLTSA